MRVNSAAERVGNRLIQPVKAVACKAVSQSTAPVEREFISGPQQLIQFERRNLAVPLTEFRILPVIDDARGVARRSPNAKRLRHQALDLLRYRIKARRRDRIIGKWIGHDLAVDHL